MKLRLPGRTDEPAEPPPSTFELPDFTWTDLPPDEPLDASPARPSPAAPPAAAGRPTRAGPPGRRGGCGHGPPGRRRRREALERARQGATRGGRSRQLQAGAQGVPRRPARGQAHGGGALRSPSRGPALRRRYDRAVPGRRVLRAPAGTRLGRGRDRPGQRRRRGPGVGVDRGDLGRRPAGAPPRPPGRGPAGRRPGIRVPRPAPARTAARRGLGRPGPGPRRRRSPRRVACGDWGCG